MKRKWILPAILFLLLLGVFFACFACDFGTDKKPEQKATPIAGTFTRRGLPFAYNGSLVTEHSYQFYLDGTVKYETGINYQSVVYSGSYVHYDGLDAVIVSLRGLGDSVGLVYTGERVSSADVDFYLTGANDRGEFSGNTALVQYYAAKGGSLVGDTTQYVKNGGAATSVTAVANDAFAFVEWSDGLKTPTRTDENVSGENTYTAIFEQVEDIFTVKYKADFGAIEGETEQKVIRGRNASAVKAVPGRYDWYRFIKWSDGVTTAERTDFNVQSDMELTALFGKELHVKYASAPGGTIEGATEQTVLTYGDCTPVTAVPAENYVFMGWSDGVKEPTRQDTNVLQDIRVSPVFKRLYTVKYLATEGGKIEGDTEQKVIALSSGTTI